MATHDKIEMDIQTTKEDSESEQGEQASQVLQQLPQQPVHTDRVFKRYLPNNKLRLYIINRDLVVSGGKIDKLQGVIAVEPDYIQDRRVYAQITLTARLSREEEEVMGVKFCNEIPFCFVQLYPPYPNEDQPEPVTPVQEALIKSRGPNAYPFTVEVPSVAPPSIRLRPPQKYNGAPLGTSYEFKAWVAECAEQKLDDSNAVRMGITVIQRGLPPILGISRLHNRAARTRECPTTSSFAVELPAPTASDKRRIILGDGFIRLEARLDRAVYAYGDPISAHVYVANDSHRSVKRIEVQAVQHVEVCMFNNGIFKNAVAYELEHENCPLMPGSTLTKTYILRLTEGSPKHWIALEESYTKSSPSLAGTVICAEVNEKDRNPYYAINVSYYVQVKLITSLMCEKITVKLPFTLIHKNADSDPISYSSAQREILRVQTSSGAKNDDKMHHKAVENSQAKCDSLREADIIKNDIKKTS